MEISTSSLISLHAEEASKFNYARIEFCALPLVVLILVINPGLT